MNKLRTIIATGLLFGASSLASAAPILTISDEGESAALLAESNFLASLQSGFITETFETFEKDGVTYNNPGDQTLTFTSQAGVGTFSSEEAGEGGLCDTNGYDCDKGLAVLDGGPTGTSPFDGRFAVSGDNWLDSMDAQHMKISPTAGFNAIGFFMTDPNDAGGEFTVNTTSFDFGEIFKAGLSSGEIYYVTIFDGSGLGDISIFTHNEDDGFGLDNVTLGSVAVPEPGTLALLGLGLVGLLLARQRKQP